jgi:hypothetical protein
MEPGSTVIIKPLALAQQQRNLGQTGPTRPPSARGAGRSALWPLLIVLLLAFRLPSLVQPAGGDQGLYVYAAQRLLAGDVMYRDVWDQKPPGISFVYMGLWRLWPHESIVPGADLAAAGLTALLLVLIGRRRLSAGAGYGAAACLLLLGDPYLQRLSGIYVRGQCEPFIALAVTAALALLAYAEGRRLYLVAAGVAFAAAVWLKYNAAAYALPLAVAAWAWQPGTARRRALLTDAAWIALGSAVVSAIVIAYFAVHGALVDLRLATIDYNLRYSNETYEGSTSMLGYLVTFPIDRARIDPLWFVGGVGALLVAWSSSWVERSNRSALVVLAWLAAAVMSIAINGSRGLPNYFVQAYPALAMAAGAGFSTLGARPLWARCAVALLLLVGLWRVGSDAPVLGLRLASLPGAIENARYDLAYARGEMDRETYVSRFRGQKHDVREVEALVRYVRDTTSSTDPIFVFGFSGGSVCWKSERVSSSRFFWSRPVLIEFAADRPGYGSEGMLQELQRRPPAVLALQNEEWQSRDFFMKNDRLRTWLESGYSMAHETPMFSVWRRKP